MAKDQLWRRIDNETELLLNTTLEYKTKKIAMVPWESVLKFFFHSIGKTRFSLKFLHHCCVLPSRIQKRLAFLVGFLIGSCDNTQFFAFSEQMRNFEMMRWQKWACKVQLSWLERPKNAPVARRQQKSWCTWSHDNEFLMVADRSAFVCGFKSLCIILSSSLVPCKWKVQRQRNVCLFCYGTVYIHLAFRTAKHFSTSYIRSIL